MSKSYSMPRLMLHIEGLVVFVVVVLAYGQFAVWGWGRFALLLLAPDLVFILYALNKRAGIVAYNLVHSYSLPLVLLAWAIISANGVGLSLAPIWLAHIGMDRTVGYGLKYADNFKDTHLYRL